MSNNIVTFKSDLFQIGESYSVSSRYEHTFIGKCVQFEPDKVVFETPYGNLPITPSMAVTQDYRFEQLQIREISGPVKVYSFGLPSEPIEVLKEPKDVDTFIDRFNKHICEHLKDPLLGQLKVCDGLVAGPRGKIDIQLHKCEVPLFKKEDIPVTKVPAPNFNMKEW